MKNALTHMDGTWEGLTFSEDGESVLETGDGIFAWLIKLFNWFVALKEDKSQISRLKTTKFLLTQVAVLTVNGRVGSCLTTW